MLKNGKLYTFFTLCTYYTRFFPLRRDHCAREWRRRTRSPSAWTRCSPRSPTSPKRKLQWGRSSWNLTWPVGRASCCKNGPLCRNILPWRGDTLRTLLGWPDTLGPFGKRPQVSSPPRTCPQTQSLSSHPDPRLSCTRRTPSLVSTWRYIHFNKYSHSSANVVFLYFMNYLHIAW